MSQSLHQNYPRRYVLIGLLILNLVMLAVSYALPFMQARRFHFFQEEYTLLKSIRLMFESGHYGLSIIVFVFSVVFPVGKLLMLLIVWFLPVGSAEQRRTLHWVAVLGKWSMLDVFIIAVMVVLISAQSMTHAQPLMGIYIFAAAILLSMGLTHRIQHLARNQTRHSDSDAKARVHDP